MAAMHVTALDALVVTLSTSKMCNHIDIPTKQQIISLITLITSSIRYNKADDTWSELGVKLPERRELFSAMFVENIC